MSRKFKISGVDVVHDWGVETRDDLIENVLKGLNINVADDFLGEELILKFTPQ